MKKEYLGTDGDFSVETRSKYYLVDGNLIVHSWGRKYKENPQKQIRKLSESLATLEKYRNHDDYYRTVAEIENLIKNLKLNFGR